MRPVNERPVTSRRRPRRLRFAGATPRGHPGAPGYGGAPGQRCRGNVGRSVRRRRIAPGSGRRPGRRPSDGDRSRHRDRDGKPFIQPDRQQRVGAIPQRADPAVWPGAQLHRRVASFGTELHRPVRRIDDGRDGRRRPLVLGDEPGRPARGSWLDVARCGRERSDDLLQGCDALRRARRTGLVRSQA